MATKKRKQIAFDLDTVALKMYYPGNHWQHAYDDIKRHMTQNGFQWQQGSVYVSKVPLYANSVSKIIKALITTRPWLNACMRDCVVTDIGKEHNLNHLFDKTANVLKRENVKNNSRADTKSSMKDRFAAADAEARRRADERPRNEPKKTPSQER
jgi:virulence-associated protein VapD